MSDAAYARIFAVAFGTIFAIALALNALALISWSGAPRPARDNTGEHQGAAAYQRSQSDGRPSEKCGGSGRSGGYSKARCTDSEDRKGNLSGMDEAEEGRIMSFT